MSRRAEERSEALGEALKTFGEALVAHERNVSTWAAQVALLLGADDEHAAAIRLAGLVHDIGKVAIPDEVLDKPGRLTDAEYAVVQAHSVVGEKIVRQMGLPLEAAWVRHHHERFDGSGYPDGLVGEAIPWESRIIFVADTFDAITAHRPYRPVRSKADALVELRRCAGTQFDPDCAAAMITLMDR